MQSRVHPGLSLVPLLTALLVSGCKTVEKQEDTDSGAAPLASVAAVDPLPSTTVAAPTVIVPVPTPGPAGTPKLDAGAPRDAGAGDAGKPVDAGAAPTGKFAACASKCQAVLQGCALPQITADGGLPQIKDPVACQAAATACFAACAP